MSTTADFLIIGGGMAGASLGHGLAPHGRVVLLERESQPGYHATGRSAALFLENYGTPQVRALTRASRAFLQSPPPGFSQHPVLSPRGVLMVATPGQEALLAAHWAETARATPNARLLDATQACALVPVLRSEKIMGAVFEPDAMDMDVHSIHQGFLRGIRRLGGHLVCNAQATALHHSQGVWRVQAAGLRFEAPVVLNAAGAWADEVALLAGVRPIGLQPMRRSALSFAPPAGLSFAHWPAVASLDESWYFKPDAGMLLGSPANVDPVPAHNVQPEEMDMALAIHQIEAMTRLQIRRPARAWAGLRSVMADGSLVGGFDPQAPGFFWVAGQGGYGIQAAAAMGQTYAALAMGQGVSAPVAAFGLPAAMLSPARFN